MNLKELNEYIKNNTSLIEKHITEIKSIKKDVCKRITELKIPDESQLKPITIDELKVGDYVWFNSNDVKMSLIQIDKIDNNEIWSEHYVYNIENLFVEKDETVEKLNKSEIELQLNQLKNIVKHSVGCKYCKHKKLLPTNKICCECGIEYKNWKFEYCE